MKVLVTGVAGFIGMHCALRLTARGDEVVGLDNLSPYYSVDLKRARLKQLRLQFHQLDIADAGGLARVFEKARPEAVLHLAAQPGVRYSLENPAAYVEANLVGFANLLECCRRHPPRHLVFASSKRQSVTRQSCRGSAGVFLTRCVDTRRALPTVPSRRKVARTHAGENNLGKMLRLPSFTTNMKLSSRNDGN